VSAATALPDSRPSARWELYRLLGDPTRLKLLALCASEELAVGELAELLRELQPKVSRHAAALREAGLLDARRQGTWVLLRLAPSASRDSVVSDAIRAGLDLCQADGTLERVAAVTSARDAETRAYFARRGKALGGGPPEELGAYLAAVAPLIPERRLAVDAGTGDGALLEVLSPLFERVVALDRSEAQLDLARERAAARKLTNVRFVRGELDGKEIEAAMQRSGGKSGADAVFAVRVLHHAPAPARAMKALARLARRGGAVIVVDYEPHRDEALRERQADLWLGFDGAELTTLATAAGLCEVRRTRLPAAWCGEGPDRHLKWQLLAGKRT
jgi:ArsR family transcriptional regulator